MSIVKKIRVSDTYMPAEDFLKKALPREVQGINLADIKIIVSQNPLGLGDHQVNKINNIKSEDSFLQYVRRANPASGIRTLLVECLKEKNIWYDQALVNDVELYGISLIFEHLFTYPDKKSVESLKEKQPSSTPSSTTESKRLETGKKDSIYVDKKNEVAIPSSGERRTHEKYSEDNKRKVVAKPMNISYSAFLDLYNQVKRKGYVKQNKGIDVTPGVITEEMPVRLHDEFCFHFPKNFDAYRGCAALLTHDEKISPLSAISVRIPRR